jgi:ankyrin repeat protein
LHYVALCGLHTVVKLLVIEPLENVDAEGFEANTIPLHLASAWGYLEVVLLLLGRGANLTAQDHRGSTPPRLASWWGHTEVARVLRERRGDAAADGEDESIPMVLELEGWADVASALSQFGSDLDARDNVIWVPSENVSSAEFHIIMQQINPPEDWDGESDLV